MSTSMPFNLTAIALLLLLFGLGIAYTLDALVNRRTLPAESPYGAPFLTQTLAGTIYKIPKSWFHTPAPVNGEFADQIDLRINIRLVENGPLVPIDLRLVPSARAQPSGYLLDAVYLRRFSGKQVSGPVGLVGKPLKEEAGFQNETVWYDPLSQFPFVAKCIDAISGTETAKCLRTVHLADGIALTYQFDAKVLANWREFDAILEPWLQKIGAISNE